MKVTVKVAGRYNGVDGKAKTYRKGDTLNTAEWYAESLEQSGLVEQYNGNPVGIIDTNVLLDFFNQAELAELMSLPRISKAIAEQIITMRPIAQLGKVETIKGISKATLDKLVLYLIPDKPNNIDSVEVTPQDKSSSDIVEKLKQQIGTTKEVKKK